MNSSFFPIVVTGFTVAFFHAVIPTHWLPFVLAARAQRWSHPRTLAITAIAGGGHVFFTTLLGVLIAWLGIEANEWTGNVFPWIAGGALILFGLFYVMRQLGGKGHGHTYWFGGRSHGAHGLGGHDHEHGHEADGRHSHADHDHSHAHPHPHSHDHEHDAHHSTTVVEAHQHEVLHEPKATSDWVAIGSLLALLTFSPCEGFLPVYLSGIRFGWLGFALLSAILAGATLAGMVLFTWLTLIGIEKLHLKWVEKFESGILGGLLVVLGILVIVFEH